MKTIFLLFIILLFSCENKDLKKPDILFEIQNKELTHKNILLLNVVNNSKKNYFICFDTVTIYNNTTLNYTINDCVHPTPIFYLDNDSIGSIIHSNMFKSKAIDTSQMNCLKKNRLLSVDYINDFKNLKIIIILGSKTTTTLKLPFDNRYSICNNGYTYLIEKGKYQVQFKYKMDKYFFNEIVNKKAVIQLKNKNIEPYFYEITSNKVPLILK